MRIAQLKAKPEEKTQCHPTSSLSHRFIHTAIIGPIRYWYRSHVYVACIRVRRRWSRRLNNNSTSQNSKKPPGVFSRAFSFGQRPELTLAERRKICDMAENTNPWNKTQIAISPALAVLTLVITQYQRHTDDVTKAEQDRQKQIETGLVDNVKDRTCPARIITAGCPDTCQARRRCGRLAPEAGETNRYIKHQKASQCHKEQHSKSVNVHGLIDLNYEYVKMLRHSFFTFENQGRTAAYQVGARGGLIFEKGHSTVEVDSQGNVISRIFSFPPPKIEDCLSLSDLVQSIHTILPDDDYVTKYIMTVKYVDIFDKPRETQVCYEPEVLDQRPHSLRAKRDLQ